MTGYIYAGVDSDRDTPIYLPLKTRSVIFVVKLDNTPRQQSVFPL
jgi:hypothetical protein